MKGCNTKLSSVPFCNITEKKQVESDVRSDFILMSEAAVQSGSTAMDISVVELIMKLK